MVQISALGYAKIVIILFLQFDVIKCWVFHSVHSRDNKILSDWDTEEGVYPIPYEARETNAINEDDPPDPPRERITLTWPGTKWCGPGNIAMDYHDVGYYNETDKCCRTHDLCSDIIPAAHMAHGLTNNDFYTKLNCKCDERFHKCLHKTTDGIGEGIGKLYFNAIGTMCFKKEYPIVNCTHYRGFLRPKCLTYEFDKTKEKLYQWFDVPPY